LTATSPRDCMTFSASNAATLWGSKMYESDSRSRGEGQSEARSAGLTPQPSARPGPTSGAVTRGLSPGRGEAAPRSRWRRR
jgi:hypothetical protein